MNIYCYIKIPIRYFTLEIIEQYGITNITSNGYVYVEILKVMYGLKEVGIITFKRLVQKLEPHSYHPAKHTPGIWIHKLKTYTSPL